MVLRVALDVMGGVPVGRVGVVVVEVGVVVDVVTDEEGVTGGETVVETVGEKGGVEVSEVIVVEGSCSVADWIGEEVVVDEDVDLQAARTAIIVSRATASSNLLTLTGY